MACGTKSPALRQRGDASNPTVAAATPVSMNTPIKEWLMPLASKMCNDVMSAALWEPRSNVP